jgi:hypothetical protein
VEQEVPHSRAGLNSRRALKISGQMTSMIHIDMEDCIPVSRFGLLSGALDWMDSMSGAPELMDS